MKTILSNWTVRTDKVPKYVDFNQCFVEKVDLPLARIILEQADPRLSMESLEEFRKLVECVNHKTNMLTVKYAGRKGGLGRRYPDVPTEYYSDGITPNPAFGKMYSALITMPRLIKGTIYHYQGWVDFDQRKGHPTILRELVERNGGKVPFYDSYINNFDAIAEEIAVFYTEDTENPVTPKDIKLLFNKTIYSGGFKQWVIDLETGKTKNVDGVTVRVRHPKPVGNKTVLHEFYAGFLAETEAIINTVYISNAEIANVVCDTDELRVETPDNLRKRKGKVMSYFCQVIEHEITYRAYQYLVKSGACAARYVSWGYDGLTIPPLPAGFSVEKVLQGMNEYVALSTGFKHVCFVEKDFGDVLDAAIQKRTELAIAQPCLPILSSEAVDIDDETDNEDGMDEYRKWKVEFEKTHCKIISMALFAEEEFESGICTEFRLRTERDMITAYKHECYSAVLPNGKKRKVCCITTWLEDPKMRRYKTADVVPPPTPCSPTVFNLWVPFVWESKPISEEDMDFDHEAVKLFDDHLHIMSNREQVVHDYLRSWIAHSIQSPSVKPEVALTFTGKQGSGKSTISYVLTKLYGAKKVLKTSEPERDVWGSFNLPLATAYLVVLSEVDKRNSHAGGQGTLKKLITENANDKGCMINGKGKDQFGINSYHRVVTESNDLDPTRTSEDDRRNLIVRCSDENIGNTEYFNHFYSAIERPHALRSIYWAYKRMDLSRWVFRHIPRTTYHESLIECNKDPIQQFMEDFVLTNHDKPFVDLSGSQMLLRFCTWRENNGYKFGEGMNSGTLVKKIVCSLHQHNGCVVKLPRSSSEQKTRYVIPMLRTVLKLSDGSEPAVV